MSIKGEAVNPGAPREGWTLIGVSPAEQEAPEDAALIRIMRLLRPLPRETRVRVVRTVRAFFDIE